MREKIIFNNSLDSFEKDEEYGPRDIDKKFTELSMNNEKNITDFKISYPKKMETIVDMIKLMDSETLCKDVI